MDGLPDFRAAWHGNAGTVGTIYLEQDIKFKKPVRIGDKITVTAIVHRQA
jgi:acyl dehydratase